MNMNTLRIDHAYIVLALAADRVITDRAVVFHYYGPDELKVPAKALAKQGRTALVTELKKLEERVRKEAKDEAPFFRRTYLISQIRSLRGMLTLDGTKLTGIDLLEGVAAVLGMVPPLPYDIKELRSEETGVLKKHGYSSFAEFRSEQDGSSEAPVSDNDVKIFIEHLKNVSAKDVLPNIFMGKELDHKLRLSKVSLAKVKEGYPPCYYIYKGRGKAEVSVSGEHRKSKLSTIRTLMHEVFPGHHFYYLYRDALSGLGFMGDETCIDLVYSAETAMSEGVAEVMPNFISSMDRRLLRDIEITTAREHFCKKALYNVWYYMFVNESMTVSSAKAYLGECGFDDGQMDTWLRFVDDWRLYYPSYPAGTEVLKDYLKGTNGDINYLYTPKTYSVLEKLQQTRRRYEESSRETVLHDAQLTSGQTAEALRGSGKGLMRRSGISGESFLTSD